jgi:hypothetical protein
LHLFDSHFSDLYSTKEIDEYSLDNDALDDFDFDLSVCDRDEWRWYLIRYFISTFILLGY